MEISQIWSICTLQGVPKVGVGYAVQHALSTCQTWSKNTWIFCTIFSVDRVCKVSVVFVMHSNMYEIKRKGVDPARCFTVEAEMAESGWDRLRLLCPSICHISSSNCHSRVATICRKSYVRRSNFYARSQNCEKWLLALSCLSVRLSARNISAPTGRLFMKFCIWVIFQNLSRKFKFP